MPWKLNWLFLLFRNVCYANHVALYARAAIQWALRVWEACWSSDLPSAKCKPIRQRPKCSILQFCKAQIITELAIFEQETVESCKGGQGQEEGKIKSSFCGGGGTKKGACNIDHSRHSQNSFACKIFLEVYWVINKGFWFSRSSDREAWRFGVSYEQQLCLIEVRVTPNLPQAPGKSPYGMFQRACIFSSSWGHDGWRIFSRSIRSKEEEELEFGNGGEEGHRESWGLSLWEWQSAYCEVPLWFFSVVHPPSLYRNSEFNVLCSLEAKAPSKKPALSGWAGVLEKQSPSDWRSISILRSCCVLVYFLCLHTCILPQHRRSPEEPFLSSCKPTQRFPYEPSFWERTLTLTCFSQPLPLLTSHLHFLSSSPGQEGTQ